MQHMLLSVIDYRPGPDPLAKMVIVPSTSPYSKSTTHTCCGLCSVTSARATRYQLQSLQKLQCDNLESVAHRRRVFFFYLFCTWRLFLVCSLNWTRSRPAEIAELVLLFRCISKVKQTWINYLSIEIRNRIHLASVAVAYCYMFQLLFKIRISRRYRWALYIGHFCVGSF